MARRCLWVLGSFWALSTVGRAASLYLVNHAPLLLVAMSPMGSHVLLAAPSTHDVALLAVATARRMAFYVPTFYLGRALGTRAVEWVEARARMFARFVRILERIFTWAPRTVVLLAAGPTVSALAGMSGMRLGTYLGLATLGLAVRLAIWIQFADFFSGPIERLLEWIDEYWVPGTIVIVLVIGVTQWRNVRRARAERASRAKLGELGA